MADAASARHRPICCRTLVTHGKLLRRVVALLHGGIPLRLSTPRGAPPLHDFPPPLYLPTTAPRSHLVLPPKRPGGAARVAYPLQLFIWEIRFSSHTSLRYALVAWHVVGAARLRGALLAYNLFSHMPLDLQYYVPTRHDAAPGLARPPRMHTRTSAAHALGTHGGGPGGPGCWPRVGPSGRGTHPNVNVILICCH